MEALVKYNLDELEKFVEQLGEKKFRARQLFSWIYSKSASDLPNTIRARLMYNTPGITLLISVIILIKLFFIF